MDTTPAMGLPVDAVVNAYLHPPAHCAPAAWRGVITVTTPVGSIFASRSGHAEQLLADMTRRVRGPAQTFGLSQILFFPLLRDFPGPALHDGFALKHRPARHGRARAP